MGSRKQQLPFGDTTLLGWAVRQAEEATLDSVIVVIGPQDSPPPTSRARVVVNTDPSQGSVSSLKAAVAAAGPVAVMVMVGDMPGVTTGTLDLVADAWRADPRWAAVASYSDESGHPLVLSPFLAAALEEKEGDKVLWPMLESAPDNEILRVSINQPRPMDVNSPADYALACLQAGFEPGSA